ncbi:proline--tRNA ligase [Magnetococcales bacterium HHB-1]
MRFSKNLISTLRQDPNEAHVVSHRLMLRAGLIRQVASGIYTWLPLGLRVLRKVENIVREEMDKAGAQEILMPAVQPAELWKESGRWDFYGKELLRLKDRHENDFCVGPTHEEVVSDLVRREIRSYKALPSCFYQIQTKFRDEIRPRFGIMRGREFLMKDAYSFDLDQASLDQSYQEMYDAYQKIFTRCGLSFRAVEADTGAIGGASSHEFHVLADSGEDTIASCKSCDYAANLEKATAKAEITPPPPPEPLEDVFTPGQKTIEEVTQFLNQSKNQSIKSLLAYADEKWYMLLLRGDHELNEAKARAAIHPQLILPPPEQAAKETGLPIGYIGPLGEHPCTIIADHALEQGGNWIIGANRENYHKINFNWSRDLPEPQFADLRNVTEGEGCPRCESGILQLMRGIEVGHVFKLGKKYSTAMNVTVLNDQGKEQIVEMGCYGIGVSRIVAAAIEQNHDDHGILWPLQLAPFSIKIVTLNPREEQALHFSQELHDNLERQGIEVLWDDRNERAGVKFKDADLLGIPVRVNVGGRSFKNGEIEIVFRHSGERRTAPIKDAFITLVTALKEMKKA